MISKLLLIGTLALGVCTGYLVGWNEGWDVGVQVGHLDVIFRFVHNGVEQ